MHIFIQLNLVMSQLGAFHSFHSEICCELMLQLLFNIWLFFFFYLFAQSIWKLPQDQMLSWVLGSTESPKAKDTPMNQRRIAPLRKESVKRICTVLQCIGASSERAGQRQQNVGWAARNVCQRGKNWGKQCWESASARSHFKGDALEYGKEYLATLVCNTLKGTKVQ